MQQICRALKHHKILHLSRVCLWQKSAFCGCPSLVLFSDKQFCLSVPLWRCREKRRITLTTSNFWDPPLTSTVAWVFSHPSFLAYESFVVVLCCPSKLNVIALSWPYILDLSWPNPPTNHLMCMGAS